ncbi:MAG: site-specific DNA-methyltransferase [Fimbriimonadales bacterium]|nr:site-specific DNA-methyltransferase [Fimbriimonadales bacterium]
MRSQLCLWETGAISTKPAHSVREQLECKYAPLLQERPDLAESVSYRANKEIPLLRLYRYKEAFAYAFVRELLREHQGDESLTVLDPFCGMGTTLLASTMAGVPSLGVDRLPIGVFVAKALLSMLDLEPGAVRDCYEQLVALVPHLPEAEIAEDVAIMKVAFEPSILSRLRQWKSGILSLPSPQREVMTLLFLSIWNLVATLRKTGSSSAYGARSNLCLLTRRFTSASSPPSATCSQCETWAGNAAPQLSQSWAMRAACPNSRFKKDLIWSSLHRLM